MVFSGTADTAPISVRSDPGKTFVYLLLCLLVIPLLWPNYNEQGLLLIAVGDLFVGLMALIAMLMVFRLFRPMRLILSPEGIEYSTGLRQFRYSWSDVTDVSSSKWYDGRVNHYATVVSLRPGHGGTPKKNNVLRIQGRGWELAPGDLADLVIEAKSRWVTAK